MFWRRRQSIESDIAITDKPVSAKVKTLSPKAMMEQQIKQLTANQCLTYRLNDSYGGGDMMAVVALESSNNGKDRSYVLSVDKMVREAPVGARICVKKSENPGDIIGWIHKYGSKNHS